MPFQGFRLESGRFAGIAMPRHLGLSLALKALLGCHKSAVICHHFLPLINAALVSASCHLLLFGYSAAPRCVMISVSSKLYM